MHFGMEYTSYCACGHAQDRLFLSQQQQKKKLFALFCARFVLDSRLHAVCDEVQCSARIETKRALTEVFLRFDHTVDSSIKHRN
jgi:capsule polysaccharide export protein KpsC/LpsZ